MAVKGFLFDYIFYIAEVIIGSIIVCRFDDFVNEEENKLQLCLMFVVMSFAINFAPYAFGKNVADRATNIVTGIAMIAAVVMAVLLGIVAIVLSWQADKNKKDKR